jgi:hypothetical protein
VPWLINRYRETAAFMCRRRLLTGGTNFAGFSSSAPHNSGRLPAEISPDLYLNELT